MKNLKKKKKKKSKNKDRIIATVASNPYSQKVRMYNDEISDDKKISDKLYELENTLNDIFELIEKRPENKSKLRRFTDHYFPTLEKCLTTYIETLDNKSEGRSVRKIREDVEVAVDTFSEAMLNLQDQIMSYVETDISSDISVMKTMMQQDYLLDNPMRLPEED